MACRILLADESPVVTAHVRLLLEGAGFVVIGVANDGFEAVTRAQDLQPDVIVLDHNMPRMNGLDVALTLRSASPGIRPIFLTQDVEEYLVVAAFRAGARAFVVKVDLAEDLTRAIREVSRGRVFLSPGACGAVMKGWMELAGSPRGSSQRDNNAADRMGTPNAAGRTQP